MIVPLNDLKHHPYSKSPLTTTNRKKTAPVSLTLGDRDLTPTQLWEFAARANIIGETFPIELGRKAVRAVNEANAFLEKLVRSGEPFYGINTGFGYFADRTVNGDQLIELQTNIIRSHCCNVGSPLPRDLTMGMWLVTLNKLVQGHSGVRLETLEMIIKMLRRGILAVIPSRGSVGASGDLSPSAHAARALLGEGLCTVGSDDGFIVISADEALEMIGAKPITLGPKEGLCLINGTALSTVLAIRVWYEGTCLLKVANAAAALAIEVLGASDKTFHPTVLAAHRHCGTAEIGKDLSQYFDEKKSELRIQHTDDEWIQDPYSFRCVPQVHGAVWEELRQAEQTLTDELNATTDNPLLFPDEMAVYNCGHFHAIYPARVCDKLASALTNLASISERRINHAMCPKRGHLPTFLVKNGGVNSGFMMAHVTAAALVSESQSLSFPASVNSIPTNIQQEDHVSMGPIAGFKAWQIVNHLRDVLAIELLCMAQALDLQRPLRTTTKLEQIWQRIRDIVPKLEKDRALSEDIQAISEAVANGEIVDFEME